MATRPILSEGVYTQMHSKHRVGSEWGGGEGWETKPNPPSIAHAFLCAFYNKAFVQGGLMEVHVSCPLVFNMIQPPTPTHSCRGQEARTGNSRMLLGEKSSLPLFLECQHSYCFSVSLVGIWLLLFTASCQREPLNCSLHVHGENCSLYSLWKGVLSVGLLLSCLLRKYLMAPGGGKCLTN